jgi:anti-anti-sigma regulatory factor
MFKITRFPNGEVVSRLSGRLDAENLGYLEALLDAESGDEIVFDLKDLILVDLDVVRFLRHCETDSIELRNCPAYIREWLNGERYGER